MIDTLWHHAPALGAVMLVNVLGWLTPGPNMLAVAMASLTRGPRVGAITGLGVASGGLIWASLAVLGVGVVFQTLPTLFLIFKVAGGLYLVWLGWRTWRAPPVDVTAGAAAHPPHRAFLFGMSVNLTNPKAMLFHGAVLAAVVPVDAPAWLLVAIVILAQVQAALQHVMTAVLFGTRAAGGIFARLGTWSNRLFGTLFAALGAGLIVQALRRG